MAQIFMTSIMQKLVIATTNSNSLQNLAYGTALSKLRDRKEGLIENFNNHGVTKEILAGATAATSYLPVGNLNSFIGFYEGDAQKDVDKIVAILNQGIKVRKGAASVKRTRNSAIFGFAVESPSLKSIWDATKYPQGNQNVSRDGSWADDLETRGIVGLEFYIYKAAGGFYQSRSGPAVQVPEKNGIKRKKIRTGSMGAVPYIRELINNFVNSMQ